MILNLQHNVKLLMLGILFPVLVNAQVDFNKTPDDDLGNNEDEFQEAFFEALKQKGIENYDRAVASLEKCLTLDDRYPTVYFELGKNYNRLKKFKKAEDALKKAAEQMPDNEWVLDELYDVYMKQKDYDNAISTVKQLVSYHPDYKQDLASILVAVEQYDEALKILDELDRDQGINADRDKIRNSIYAITGRKNDQIENLEKRVSNNPQSEDSYLELIYRYSANNDKEKAFALAKKLQDINPDSELVHLALYKFYLDDGNADKAIQSMETVVKSNTIKPDAKVKVLKDFVSFVAKNPQYETKLLEATQLVSNNADNADSLVQMAQMHIAKNEKDKALEFYERALKKDANNFGILRNVLLLYIDNNKFELAHKKATEALELYPSQPILYLADGVALNKMTKFKKAIQSLEIGLDYIIDDKKMEADFYMQLSKSYAGMNNLDKAEKFKQKAQKLVQSH